MNKDLFRRAKEIIQERGWRQHKSDPYDTRVCLGIALDMAGGVYGYYNEALGFTEGVVSWNDKPGRTLEEVHALLDRAIKRAP